MTNIDRELFFSIASDYTPYDQFEEFHEGFLDFEHGLHHNPYDASPGKDFEAQAWTCGQEAALRYVRAAGEHNAIPLQGDNPRRPAHVIETRIYLTGPTCTGKSTAPASTTDVLTQAFLRPTSPPKTKHVISLHRQTVQAPQLSVLLL